MPTDETAAGPLRVLHVDDDGVNRFVLDQLLTALGHRPTAAASAAQAIGRLLAQRFDLVMTDIHMPEQNGIALLREVRRIGFADLPVVAVTADLMTCTEEEYRALGFAAVLTKPMLLVTLRRALTEAFAAAPPDRADPAQSPGRSRPA